MDVCVIEIIPFYLSLSSLQSLGDFYRMPCAVRAAAKIFRH